MHACSAQEASHVHVAISEICRVCYVLQPIHLPVCTAELLQVYLVIVKLITARYIMFLQPGRWRWTIAWVSAFTSSIQLHISSSLLHLKQAILEILLEHALAVAVACPPTDV